MIDERKKELYNLLRNLSFEVIHKDKSSFLRVREVYDALIKEIFNKTRFRKGEEGFEWTDVANRLWIIFDYMDMEYNAIKEGNFEKKGEAIILRNKSLDDVISKIDALNRFFKEDKNFNLRTRKKRLFEEFEELYKFAKKGKREEYDNLNRDCSEKVTEIFGEFRKGDEGFEWDLAKNMILGILLARINKNKNLLKHYEDSLKKQKKLLRTYLK